MYKLPLEIVTRLLRNLLGLKQYTYELHFTNEISLVVKGVNTLCIFSIYHTYQNTNDYKYYSIPLDLIVILSSLAIKSVAGVDLEIIDNILTINEDSWVLETIEPTPIPNRETGKFNYIEYLPDILEILSLSFGNIIHIDANKYLHILLEEGKGFVYKSLSNISEPFYSTETKFIYNMLSKLKVVTSAWGHTDTHSFLTNTTNIKLSDKSMAMVLVNLILVKEVRDDSKLEVIDHIIEQSIDIKDTNLTSDKLSSKMASIDSQGLKDDDLVPFTSSSKMLVNDLKRLHKCGESLSKVKLWDNLALFIFESFSVLYTVYKLAPENEIITC